MPQDLVLVLLRHISNAVPLDARQMPEEISELTLAQACLLAELFELDGSGKEPLSLSVLAQKTGFSKATVCATLKNCGKRVIPLRQAWTEDRLCGRHRRGQNHHYQPHQPLL